MRAYHLAEAEIPQVKLPEIKIPELNLPTQSSLFSNKILWGGIIGYLLWGTRGAILGALAGNFLNKKSLPQTNKAITTNQPSQLPKQNETSSVVAQEEIESNETYEEEVRRVDQVNTRQSEFIKTVVPEIISSSDEEEVYDDEKIAPTWTNSTRDIMDAILESDEDDDELDY